MTRSAIFQTSLAYLAFVLCGILIIIGFLWFISLGNWKDWPPTTNYYYQLANAFQEGHLYLDTKASPVLLALPDPYEPDARQNAKGLDLQELDKIWDMSLYKEKVYLYWGPVPAVFLVIIKFFYSGEIGDQYLTFLFISGLVVFQSLFIFRIWRRFFNELSPWIVMPTLLLVAFIHPIPSMLSLPRIYEAAIASDQFFFIGGLYFVFSGLDRPAISAWRLTLAGTFWAFAFGSRIIMALPISFLSVMVILWVLSKKRSGMTAPQKFKALAGLIIPMLVVAVSLGWYNFVRFDSVFEFGFRYAITMLNQRKFYSVLFSTSYIFPNLYVYLFNPPSFTGVFPFFRQIWNEEFISNFNNYYHTIYNAERIAGIIYSAPFLLFALISGFFTWGSDFISDMGRRRKETRLGENEDRQRLFDFLLISLIGALVLEFLTVLLVFYATMRYFMDVIPTLVLLSVIGFWRAYQKFGKRSISKYLYTITAVFLIILSIVISILFAFSSDPARIRSYNPGLLPHLRLFFTYLLKTLGK
ncbi:MAG: hypothetical protein K8S20_13245 [Chloroflexi bacterium]|nr:hypothetical protein [Chloroflexota bacterium]